MSTYLSTSYGSRIVEVVEAGDEQDHEIPRGRNHQEIRRVSNRHNETNVAEPSLAVC